MRTIADEWEDYWQRVKPASYSYIQFEEMRTSFYAGAFAFYTRMWELGDMSDEEGADELNKMSEEVESFLKGDIERRSKEDEEDKTENKDKSTIH